MRSEVGDSGRAGARTWHIQSGQPSRLGEKLGPKEKWTPGVRAESNQTPPGLQSAGPEATLCSTLSHKLPLITSGKPFSIVYSVEENVWNGKVSLQLQVRDIR